MVSYEQTYWGQGENFNDRPLTGSEYLLSAGVRNSMYVNLPTEDNLTSYGSGDIRTFAQGSSDSRVEQPADEARESSRHGDARLGAHQSCIDPTPARRGPSGLDEKWRRA